MFDRVAILDWSSAGVPVRGANSIWLGVASGDGVQAVNLPTRAAAAGALDDLVRDSLACRARLLIGVDFLLGYPAGFARTLTGSDDPFAVWAWVAARITDDARNRHNLRDVAAAANAAFAGPGPFWGNGARAEVPGLTRTRPPTLPPGLSAHRATEIAARAAGAQPKTAWQLAGAGSVGAQGLVGLPVLHRLRHVHAGQVAVWPFEDIAAPAAPIVLAEVYPSLLAAEVAAACARDPDLVRDAAQVRLLAAALRRLACEGGLAALFELPEPGARSEGWIVGVRAEAALRAAASPGDAAPAPWLAGNPAPAVAAGTRPRRSRQPRR